MKKIFAVLFILLLVLTLSSCTYELPTATAVQELNPYIQDKGKIEIYFCPHDDCETALLTFLDSAQESIHCALYETSLPSLQEKLLEKEKAMEVQVVTDDGYLKKFNYSFVKADRGGLMHNKFCIIDHQKIFTGSMNPTENCAKKNNNNLLLIESKLLAENYEQEFQELWNNIFKKGTSIPYPLVNLNGIKIENYFCPEDSCADHLKEELKKAAESIYFMTFSFTHQEIANILLLKKMDGLKIKGIMEARQVSKYSVFEQLAYQEIDLVKDTNPNNMHHKVFIIDNETIITGSFNPTTGGDKSNDENVLIIHDKEITAMFLKEFEKIRNKAEE